MATPSRPTRPPGLAHGRWLGDFSRLSAAEKAFIAACATGNRHILSTERPTRGTKANTIRAGLIRFMLLGGDADHPLHEKGVALEGAWISDTLDLEGAHTDRDLALWDCHCAETIIAHGARLGGLHLGGSAVPGLDADGIKVGGGVFLRDGFAATGEVRLLGAGIGGDLDCGGGSFTNRGGRALSADRIKVGGRVYLREGFAATGEVWLLGADIGGDLDCSGGSFFNPDGRALNAQAATIGGVLFLRQATVTGPIDLAAAKAGTLVDDLATWQGAGANAHILDGFCYDRIVRFTDAASRIAWLGCQRADLLDSRDFCPQPWEQLIKVLREMGHPHAAAAVGAAKQEAMREAGKIATPGDPLEGLKNTIHRLFGRFVGYGYQPTRAIGFAITVWLACAFAFSVGGDYGYFGPTSPALELSPRFADCGPPHQFPDRRHWTGPRCTPPEYSSFQPLAYSLDLILPVVNLAQENDWGPIVSTTDGITLWPGWWLRALGWFEILFGWGTTLMLAAVLSNMVKKD